MSKKALNIIIGIVFAFIVLFLGGSFAYEDYKMRVDDERYEQQTEQDMNNASNNNQSGATNSEAKK